MVVQEGKNPKTELERILAVKIKMQHEEQRRKGVEPCFTDEKGVYILKDGKHKEYIEVF